MLANWVQETTATTGTGTITLGGAVSGFAGFDDQFSDGDLVRYTIEDGTSRESGIGTFTLSGTTLARTTVIETLVSGVIDRSSPTAINLSGSAVVSISAISDLFVPKQKNLVDATLPYHHADNFTRLGEVSAKGGGAFTASAGRITARPIFFKAETIITTMGTLITGASAGGNFAMAIYGGNSGTLDDDDLLAETGNLSTTTAVLTLATLGTPLTLKAGWYWLLVKVDNTVATFSGARPINGNMLQSPMGARSAEAIGSGGASYWDTTYATGWLSTIAAYGARDNITQWETPELIYS